MKNHSLLTPIFFIFWPVFIFCHFTVATSTPPYKAVDHIALNCGTSGNSNPPDGRNWTGEIGSKYGPTEQNNKSTFSDTQSHSSVGTVPYTTARLSHFQFTYAFPVAAGPKFVRLYFYSASYSGYEKSKDFFTVKAGSFTLLGNFSTSDSTESKNFFKEFCINVEENQILKLTFIPFSSDYYAFINGIEIVSMPIDLYYSQKGFIKDDWVPLYVAQAPQFYINYSMALEMVYRLNVGGNLVPPMEDTGMFREWSEAVNKYSWRDGDGVRVIPRDPSLKPKYSKIPNYTAPDPIYQSAITMGPNRAKNMQSNLTWGLPVDTGFYYLVRLHFCESWHSSFEGTHHQVFPSFEGTLHFFSSFIRVKKIS